MHLFEVFLYYFSVVGSDSFLSTQQRQRDNATTCYVELQGETKFRKNVKTSVSTYVAIMQKATIFDPENMVTLSRQCCRVPSSVIFLCTGELLYVPYSFSLFSKTFCFSWILDFSTCIIFHIGTSADMKYYANVL